MKFLIGLLLSFNLMAADVLVPDNKNAVMKYKDASGNIWPAMVLFTSDGNGTPNPIPSTATTIGTVAQGAAGVAPWLIDFKTINGAAPSATNYIPFRLTDGTGYISTLPVSAASLPLPTGAATAAKQDTGNTSLSSIDTKIVAGTAGQKVVAVKELDEIGRGNISGKKSVRILGKSTANVNNTLADIWDIGGVYAFPAAAIQMQVVSASANDAAAGTGVRTVKIYYLDNSYAEQTETVTLNGTTPVNTVTTNILRVNQLHAVTVGSGGVAAGNISLQSVGGATNYSRINAGVNYARQCIYTVPAGKTLYLTALHGNSYAAAAGHTSEVSLRTTSSLDGTSTPGVFQFKETVAVTDSGAFIDFSLPVKIPAQADVKASCISDGASVNATCLAHFEGWIE